MRELNNFFKESFLIDFIVKRVFFNIVTLWFVKNFIIFNLYNPLYSYFFAYWTFFINSSLVKLNSMAELFLFFLLVVFLYFAVVTFIILFF